MHSPRYKDGESDLAQFNKATLPAGLLWRKPLYALLSGMLANIDHIYRLFAGVRPQETATGLTIIPPGRPSVPIYSFTFMSERLVKGYGATAVTHVGVVHTRDQRDYHAIYEPVTISHVAAVIELEPHSTGVTRKFHVNCVPTTPLAVAAGERIGFDIAFGTYDTVDQDKFLVAVMRYPKEAHHTVKSEITDEVPHGVSVYKSTEMVLDTTMRNAYTGPGLRFYGMITIYA